MPQANQIGQNTWVFAHPTQIIQAFDGSLIQMLGGEVVLPPSPRDGATVTARIARADTHLMQMFVRVHPINTLDQTIGASQPGAAATSFFLIESEDADQAIALNGRDIDFIYSVETDDWIVQLRSAPEEVQIYASVPATKAGNLIIVEPATGAGGLYRWSNQQNTYTLIG